MNSLVSIITPNFNSSRYIKHTWNSIKSQTYENWEWIIVDDGSTDDSINRIKELCNSDKRVKLFHRDKPNKGASTCRNIGLQSAKGNFVIFLDADDILARESLYNRVIIMNKSPELDFAVFRMGIFNNTIGDCNRVISEPNNTNNNPLARFLSYQLPWTITSPIWSRHFITKNNIQFSENYQRLQDPEFHTKILLLHNPKYKVFTDIEPDCYYRQPCRRLNISNIGSIKKTIASIKLYYSEMNHLLTHNRPEALHYLDNFSINIFHSLLFYTKLPAIKPVAQLYRDMNNIRQITSLSYNKVMLFAIFNVLGLTFIKGAGVSRLWKILNS